MVINIETAEYDTESVIVEARGIDTYDFARIGATDDEAVDRANHYIKKKVQDYARLCKEREGDDYWKDQLATAKKKAKAGYVVMSFEELDKHKRHILLTKPVTESTKEQFEYALNVLPPLYYTERSGVIMFCMREMYTATFTTQYAYDRHTDKYYCKMVDCTDTTTWINNYLAS